MSPENLSEDQQPDSEEIQRHADLTNDLLNIRAEAAQEADYDPQPMPEAGPEAGPERDQIFEQASAERGGFLRDTLTSSLVSNGLDLVPFVGGGKMLVESIAGQTLNGEEIDRQKPDYSRRHGRRQPRAGPHWYRRGQGGRDARG